MPNFPQYQNADLVTYSNYRALVLTGSTGGAITANSGDVIQVEVNAVNVSGTGTVTLPQVAHGGPVLVRFTHTNANTAFGTAAKCTIIPQISDTVAGVLIDGWGSVSLSNLGEQVVLCSDGVQWWLIDKNLNTHETF